MFVKKDIGPYWSIPNQVHAQSKLDNVMWYNLQAVEDGYWKEKANYKNINLATLKTLGFHPKP